MKIALIQVQRQPNPDYANMADGLRERGHTVYLGALNSEAKFFWHDGERLVADLGRPFQEPEELSRFSGVRSFEMRRQFWQFLRRLRRSLVELDPAVVQLDPGVMYSPWGIPLGMPRTMKFVFDIKQINVGIGTGFKARFKEWWLVRGWEFCARHVYDYTLFDYPYAAEAVLGERWDDLSAVVPVGLNADLLTVERDPDCYDPDCLVRFVYVGGLTRFRELERLLQAIQLAARETRAFRVDFVGPENSGGYYPALVHDLGLGDIVSFRPPVDYAEIPQLLAAYDVGLAYNPDRLTWHYQPTIKVKEYRAVGLPIISTDVRSHRDFVEAEVNGVLVPNTAVAWAEAIVRFVMNPPFRRATAERAAAMRMGSTIAEVAQMHEAVYVDKLGLEGCTAVDRSQAQTGERDA